MSSLEPSNTSRREELDKLALAHIRRTPPTLFCYDDLEIVTTEEIESPSLLEMDYIFSRIFTYYNLKYEFNFPSAVVAHFMIFKDYFANHSSRKQSAYDCATNRRSLAVVEAMGCTIQLDHTESLCRLFMDPGLFQATKREEL